MVDPGTGDMWVAVLAHPLKVSDYFKDRSVAVASKCLHVRMDPSAELPFSNSTMEEVFSSDGEALMGAVSVCMYVQGRLLLGSIGMDMTMCDAPYLMY